MHTTYKRTLFDRKVVEDVASDPVSTQASVRRVTTANERLRAAEKERQKQARRVGEPYVRLTMAEIRALVAEAGGRCAICDRERALQVDHDHTTGITRGMLCHDCNRILSKLGDGRTPATRESLERAVAYLS